MQRLPIEPISQASANQRAGRCGRVADGICIRLYAEEDFDARPEFTDPEILRTNLASVILQMAALGLGDVERVPVRRAAGPPQRRATASRCCRSSARSTRRATAQRLTAARPPAGPAAGRPAARPDGPRGRPAAAASREVLVIAAGAVDPGPARAARRARSRPADAAARPLRRRATRTSSPTSTCGDYLREQQRELSSATQFRRLCRAEFLQLPADPRVAGPARPAAPGRAKALGITRRTTHAGRARRPIAHQALLAGLLSHVGAAATPEQPRVPRRARRAVRDLPGLGAVQEAAALGDGRRAGRDVPAVGAGRSRGSSRSGSSRSAGHLVKRTYSEPHWETKRGAVVALRAGHAVRRADRRRPQVAVRPDRPGAVARAVHPPRAGRGRLARPTTAFFARQPRGCSSEVEELEDRARRRDILVDDETLFDVLRRADPGRRRLRPALRPLVEEGPPGRPGPARPSRQRLLVDDARPAVSADDYPTTDLDAGRAAAAAVLPVRAGHASRRRDRPHPARRARPGRPRPGSTGRCPGCARSWSPR